ncbi:MAG: glycine betaine ABC transporter substrate-binding protein [Arenicella sp.]
MKRNIHILQKAQALPILVLSVLTLMFLLTTQAVQARATIKIGSEGYTEQILLTEITAQYLEEKGFKVDYERGLKNQDLRDKLERNEVNLHWEYVATSYLAFHKQTYNGEPIDIIYSRVKIEDAKKDIIWLNMSNVNDTYALAMRTEEAQQKKIKTISDLAHYQNTIGGLTLASDPTWTSREDDGLKPLQKKYNFSFPPKDIERIGVGQVYGNLRDGNYDVGLVYSTDGRIASMNLTILEDDRRFFPPYIITPIIHAETLRTYPELKEHLNKLSSILTDDSVMTELNSKVDVQRILIWEVAEEFLIKNGLL